MNCRKDEFILQKSTAKINRQDAKRFLKDMNELIFPKITFNQAYFFFQRSNGIWRAPVYATARQLWDVATSVNHRME